MLRGAFSKHRAGRARERCRAHVTAGLVPPSGPVPFFASDSEEILVVSPGEKDEARDPAFLGRLELWLLLAEDSPGVTIPG